MREGCQHLEEFVLVLFALRLGGEPRIGAFALDPENLRQLAELIIGGGAQRDIAVVAGLEELRRGVNAVTVADALARVRDADLPPALAAQVYVVRPPFETPTGRYLGVAHFQRLLREPPSTLVSAVLDDSLEPIGPDAPLGQVTRYFATYNLVALPVVDEDDHLLGAVTVDDVIDHMLPENWRDADTADLVDEEEV